MKSFFKIFFKIDGLDIPIYKKWIYIYFNDFENVFF